MTMNLPHPFESARDIRPDAFGRVALIDGDGRVLAHLPLSTAHEFAPAAEREDGSGRYGMVTDLGAGYGYFGYGVASPFGDGKSMETL
jgi:hypothetical protein